MTELEVSAAKPPEGFRWEHEVYCGQRWNLRRNTDNHTVVVILPCVMKWEGQYHVHVEHLRWSVQGFRAPSLSRALVWGARWATVHRERLLVEPKEPFGGWPKEADEDDGD